MSRNVPARVVICRRKGKGRGVTKNSGRGEDRVGSEYIWYANPVSLNPSRWDEKRSLNFFNIFIIYLYRSAIF